MPCRVEALAAESLLNHSMLVLSPFEAFDCKRPPDSKVGGSSRSGEPLTGKQAGVIAAQGEASSTRVLLLAIICAIKCAQHMCHQVRPSHAPVIRGWKGPCPVHRFTAALSFVHTRDHITHCTGSKSSLYDLYRANCVTIFHCARGTHWYNNYTRWFDIDGGKASIGGGKASAADSAGVPAYELPYGFLYEPWFIGHRCEEDRCEEHRCEEHRCEEHRCEEHRAPPDETLWAQV